METSKILTLRLLFIWLLAQTYMTNQTGKWLTEQEFFHLHEESPSGNVRSPCIFVCTCCQAVYVVNTLFGFLISCGSSFLTISASLFFTWINQHFHFSTPGISGETYSQNSSASTVLCCVLLSKCFSIKTCKLAVFPILNDSATAELLE